MRLLSLETMPLTLWPAPSITFQEMPPSRDCFLACTVASRSLDSCSPESSEAISSSEPSHSESSFFFVFFRFLPFFLPSASACRLASRASACRRCALSSARTCASADKPGAAGAARTGEAGGSSSSLSSGSGAAAAAAGGAALLGTLSWKRLALSCLSSPSLLLLSLTFGSAAGASTTRAAATLSTVLALILTSILPFFCMGGPDSNTDATGAEAGVGKRPSDSGLA
mmetsp:Transcript_44520/g.80608  ORF Transcript_44520/g.80608 Transcript_44520/m.80608 type:complete len:227 (+) Transcript_44520:357-1037(+)